MIIYYSNNYNKDRIDSHSLLERAIAKYTGDDERARTLVEGVYKSTEYGKPAIKEFEDFSISHSGDCWAVLIDNRKDTKSPCGLDIQYAKSSAYESVSRKYYSEEEQKLVEKEGMLAFFRLWSRREALVKAVGTTIVNKKLPAVLSQRVDFEGHEWRLQDVGIPGTGENVLAAICYLSESDRDEEVIYVEL